VPEDGGAVRVLHVDSARTWRGGQNQVLLAARGMASRGHEVAVACQEGGVLAARAREAGLLVHPLSFRGDLSPGAVLPLAGLLGRFHPEVAQLHDPHAVSAGLLAARLRPGTRLLATRRVDFPLRGMLSRAKYRACHRVLAVSRAIAAVLRGAGLAEARIRVVYEGVPDRPAQAGGRAALSTLGVPEGAPVVGNVAALTDHKDHATFLAAAARVAAARDDVRFVIAGDGERRSALEAQARELGLAERVAFAGFRDDLDRLIPAFDVFCLSSQMEGLGTSLLDAMAFARPVVATRAGGIPEAVQDGVTGRLVPVRDPEALAGALLDVLADPARAAALGAAGRRRYQAEFTADRMVEQTLLAYAEGA
jgi:glycosyltransferase involved in cell wall biosynthesis